MLARAFGAALGVMLRCDVTCDIRGPTAGVNVASYPLTLATARLSSFSMEASDANGLIPFASASLSSRAPLTLGWKCPALLLVPVWLVVAPRLLPLLLGLWLALPAGPQEGAIDFDVVVTQRCLRRRGLWRWLLGGVLTTIARSSLPALLAGELVASYGVGDASVQLPPSECVGVAVEGDKLVLEGRTQQQAPDEPALEYTMRTGVRPLLPGETDPMANEVAAKGASSALLWENPEIRLSLGEKGIAGMLPKLWVPVMSATAIALPRGVDLQRASVSSAADGLVLSGAIRLGGQQGVQGRTGPTGGWTDAERAALRLPPSA